MSQVLDGLKIIDFTFGMAGGLATMVMADNGAEVIKVEPPAGDPFRSLPAFRQWHRGKKSVILDLKTEYGREQARHLATSGDIVLEAFRPGVAERLGIGYQTLSARNPRLVYCSITGFGQKGPYAQYKAYEGIVQAKSGRMMEFQGELEREGPAFAAVPVASFSASQLAVQGILAALYVRNISGRGQKVSTSLVQGAGCYDLNNWLRLQLHRRSPDVFPAPMSMGPSYHYLVAPTADGYWIQFANAADRLFRAFTQAIGMEAVFEAAGVFGKGLVSLGMATEELWEVLLLKIQEKTLTEWMEIFMKDLNISAEPFRWTEEAMEHPQAVYNGHAVDIEDPELGKTRQLGPLISFTKTPSRIGSPAPLLGQHTREGLSAREQPAQEPGPDGSLPKHALEGVTVLELASYYATPFGASLLADLGARVIKIEPFEGDPMRGLGSIRTIQGKESIALDLKTPEARQVFYKLVEQADALVHNFRPGVPERLGLDHETLQKINPNLVYLYAASYGSTGPYALKPAFHPTFGAICGGVLYQAGEGTPPSSGSPLGLDEMKRISQHLAKANEANPDPNAAMVVGTALMMGLYARQRTGQGQYLETTMLCSNLYANSDDAIKYAGKPPRQLPDAELYGIGALYRLYRARDGWVFLACITEHEWESLCAALDRHHLLEDERFASRDARVENNNALAMILQEALSARPAGEWEEYLNPRGVPCVVADAGRYYEFFNEDPTLDANDMTVEATHPLWGKYRRHAPNIQMSLTPGIAGSGGRVGENTEKILTELGYSPSEIHNLKQKGAVSWPE